ncbi:twin-arginine translocase TatA/TatE family subunit [Longibacter salinarum]|uniref:Sec-independent protein translocase protein TatA n=1 Tax=Longibacter salinarum TaxID=1850348 RepID=A0A2A8CYB2_9BACT|nr:twin-arginine translocase TatA/TatE family subunit [Longibacter salinarum]PEN13368.1 twin-arginine translocase TatA/TatE family subunit [Longibacter salinarum]
MGTPGPLELFLIFLVVLLIFGANKIPEIARGIGKGIREFKDATNEISRELQAEDQRRQIDQPRPPQQGAPQARQQQQEPVARESTDDAPPEPARADNPGDDAASESK